MSTRDAGCGKLPMAISSLRKGASRHGKFVGASLDGATRTPIDARGDVGHTIGKAGADCCVGACALRDKAGADCCVVLPSAPCM